MIPSNLSLPDPPNFALETALSLQHLDRIVKALQESRCAKWNIVYQSMIFWVVDASKIGQLRRLREFSASVNCLLFIGILKCSSDVEKLSTVPMLFVGIKALPKGGPNRNSSYCAHWVIRIYWQWGWNNRGERMRFTRVRGRLVRSTAIAFSIYKLNLALRYILFRVMRRSLGNFLIPRNWRFQRGASD